MNLLAVDNEHLALQLLTDTVQKVLPNTTMVTSQEQTSGTILDPQGTMTCAQMATMMMRFCAEIAK